MGYKTKEQAWTECWGRCHGTVLKTDVFETIGSAPGLNRPASRTTGSQLTRAVVLRRVTSRVAGLQAWSLSLCALDGPHGHSAVLVGDNEKAGARGGDSGRKRPRWVCEQIAGPSSLHIPHPHPVVPAASPSSARPSRPTTYTWGAEPDRGDGRPDSRSSHPASASRARLRRA